ncbi:MAG: 4-(cytidine 5'-diphospho)-2-C-methyl-D-erythritol kinase, partial [Bacteroidia bacterium]|nr:4-(cytidine 5'-diphospho)-2-C-methyl-D-erythritol kinase [Bacteroidia bacterium]
MTKSTVVKRKNNSYPILQMIVFPNCKINLGLNILRKRSDKHHDLETVFYPVPLTDILEIVTNKEPRNSHKIPFTSSGLPIITDSGNLCIKAYKLLKKKFPEIPRVRMHLHKVIPLGAGLGGGSADASFSLKLLNKKFDLGLSKVQLLKYALQIGSDCPFFIVNKPCIASGRGEKMKEIPLDLSEFKLVIVNPGIHIDTGHAFRQIVPAVPEKSLEEVITEPITRWKDELKNDF